MRFARIAFFTHSAVCTLSGARLAEAAVIHHVVHQAAQHRTGDVQSSLATFQANLVQNTASIESLEQSVAQMRERLAKTDDSLVESQILAPQVQREKLLAGDVVSSNSEYLGKMTQALFANKATMATTVQETKFTDEQVVNVSEATAQHITTLEQLIGGRAVRSYAGLCLDGKEDHSVQMWTCAPDIDNQVWTYDVDQLTVNNKVRGCLAGADGAAGSAVTTVTCDPNSTTQHWVYNRSTGLLTGLHAWSVGSLCLDAVGADLKGGEVKLETCNGANTQVFGIIVGATGAREHVEVLNKQIWDALDPTSMHSIDMTDRRLKRIEVDMEIVEAKVREDIPPIMSTKLRHYGDNMRVALHDLYTALPADASLDQHEVDEDAAPPLGTDIGLNDPMI